MTSRWTLSAVAGATIALGLLLHAGLVDAQRRGTHRFGDAFHEA